VVAVFDASVLVKLFLTETGSDLAESLVAENRIIHCPDIVRIEVASAITRAFRRGDLQIDESVRKLAQWRQFLNLGNVRIIPHEELLEAAETLSLELRHPIADCLYLALAQERKTPFYTADEPLTMAASGRVDGVKFLMHSHV
jgi:predicted nucleic acid-binding protein